MCTCTHDQESHHNGNGACTHCHCDRVRFQAYAIHTWIPGYRKRVTGPMSYRDAVQMLRRYNVYGWQMDGLCGADHPDGSRMVILGWNGN